ncbi:unnamed protein product [Ixodes hexagonus]
MDDSEKEDSGWTLNTRKRRHTSGGSASSQVTIIDTHRENLTVIMKPIDTKKLIARLNPLTLSEMLDSIAPSGVIQIRPNYKLNLLAIDTRDSSSKKTILAKTILLRIKVQTYEPHPRSSAIGIIHGVDKEITEDDLKMAISATVPVTLVKRLGSSEVVKLVFATETLPEHVPVGHIRYKVLQYADKPRQCHKCRRFGHIQTACSHVQRCSRCGGAHDRIDCKADQPWCVNCKTTHEATSRNCPSYKTEAAVSSYRQAHKVSYPLAKSAVLSDNRNKVTGTRNPSSKKDQRKKLEKETMTPPLDDNNFPALPSNPSVTTSGSTSFKPEAAQKQQEANLAKATSTSTQRASNTYRSRTQGSNNNTQPQGIGAAVYTLATLLRTFLATLEHPFARAGVTLIDITLPLIHSWIS